MLRDVVLGADSFTFSVGTGISGFYPQYQTRAFKFTREQIENAPEFMRFEDAQ